MTTANAPDRMRVVTQTEYGSPDVLTLAEVPRPTPAPTEVLVKVHAAGVNPVDWKTRSGGGMSSSLGGPPFVLGWDVAGVVEQTARGVTTLAVGDRVFGMPWFPREAGGYGQFVTAPARQFAKFPDNLSFEEAAAVPLAALTAWQALVDTAQVEPGQTVVITAAAGGVGHFAVQFAHHLRADVVAVASERHHEWLSAHGAARVIDYTSVRFEEHVRDADVVLDLVGDGADSTATRAVRVLRPGGLLVVVPSGGIGDPTLQAAEEAGVRVTPFLVEPDGHSLAQIAQLLEKGDVEVVVDEVFALEDVAVAHDRIHAGRTRGKIVLRVSHDT
jgi:NADPH:quinone reductase-like Zn-dependent oxidoreductase